VLSPNDVRSEEGWPASTDPTADSIEPPAMGAKPGDGAGDPSPPSPPAPPPDGGGKIVDIGAHRNAGD
jgi:hypothetical protein